MMNLKNFTQSELDQRMKTLAQKERDLLHEVLLTIKEIDSRRTYLELGFGSLFDYLVCGVGYSEGSAQRRIDAARLLKEIPQIAEKIQCGEIKLNQISLVQKAAREVFKTQSVRVTADDKMELLNNLRSKSHFESQKEVASFFGLPVIELNKQKVQADESVRIEFTLSKEAFEKLKQAQELLSHAVPHQELAMFLEHVCDKIIKQKTAPKLAAPAANMEATLFSTLKKKVLSTQACCQFKSPITGKVCGNKWLPQVDHKHSRWAQGQNELSNLQRLCAQHNNLKYKKESGIAYKS
ncbi:MAG: HNH endonuclease signature motif containing protein [Bdellovibrionota bacterium]